MVVLGARTSEGKSAFALQCAYEWSKEHKVIYMSMEMTRNEAMTRLYSYITGNPNVDIFSGRHKEFEKETFRNALKTKLIFSEQYGKTIQEVESIIKDKLSHDKPDILILDYIQCIKTGRDTINDMNNYIREMRKLAIENDMLIVLCSQINRSILKDGGEPSMEGLKGTGFLEEHADKVLIFWYECKRDPAKDNTEFKVIIAKNKMGLTGFVKLKFKPETYSFYEGSMVEGESEHQKAVEEINTKWEE